jgi:UDP-N-acetylmuramyl pentapeptide phosphotransferase/UDP-N-acetylglucosamine-1-phosphate transferase
MSAFITGRTKYTMIRAIFMVSVLIAFSYFNWYPAKLFPGDTMTYSAGALAAFVAILSAVVLFLPCAIFSSRLLAGSGGKRSPK